MNVIRFLLRNSTSHVVLIILIGTVGGLSSAGLVAIIHATLSNPAPSATPLMWTYVGLCVVALFSNIGSQLLLLRLSQGAIFDLRMRLSRQILKAPLRRLEQAGTSRLLTALTGDANTLSNALFSVPLLSINLITLLACLLYVGVLSRTLLYGVIIYLVLGMISYKLPIRKAMTYMRKARKESERLFANFRALTEGNKELKLHSHRREEFFHNDLEQTALTLRGYVLVGASINMAAESWGRLLYFVFIGLLLFGLPGLMSVSTQTLTGYVLIVLYLMGPIGAVLAMIPNFTAAQVALKRLEELGLSLHTEVSDDEPLATVHAQPEWHYLEMKGVSHAYTTAQDDRTFILGPLDAVFKRGELVFLVGGNGSGKSTFAKMLTGLYPPETGEIYLNGEEITEESLEYYRQLFTAVFSDFYIFERLPGSTTTDLDEDARHYLSKLQIDHKVTVEGGMIRNDGLSQGQRKRLALLSAYLEDRPFYVFDEWAADQDPFFKHIFYTQMLPELKSNGKTILVISHDEAYYHIADRIIRLDYGQYVDERYQAREVAAEPAG